MASRDLVTFENGKYKRRVSSQETIDFLSVKIGSTGLEISESTGAFDFASKKLTDIADAVANSDAPSWGQVKTYIASQAVTGGTVKEQILTEIQLDNTLGILPGLVTFLTVNAVADDTVVLKDAAGNTETYTFKASASLPFEVTVGGSIANTMSNLATAINTDSAYWKAWYDVSVLDSIYPNGLIGIYREAVGANAAFKLWSTGTASGYVTDYHAEIEYKTNSGVVIAIPSSEPATALSGFSKAKADLQNGEIHNCIAEDKLKSWNGDFNEGAGSWMTMSEGAIPVATSASGGGILGKATVDSDKGVEITGVGIIKAKIDNVSTYFDGSGNIAIKADGVDKTKINSDVAGAGLGQNVDGSLEVNVGNGLEISADAVAVKPDATGGANLAKVISSTTNGISVKIDDSTIGENGSNQLYVKADGITKTEINSDVAGAGLGQNVDGSLEVNVDGSTIEITTDALNVKAGGIGTTQLAADSVTKDIINSDIAGLGLSQAVGGELDVNVDGTTLEISTDALQIKAGGVGTSQLANDSVDKDKINSDVAGAGLGQNIDGSLEVNVDGSSLEISTDTIQVKADGITKTHINSDVAGLGLSQAVGGELDVNVDGTTLEISTDALQVKDGGISTAKLANDSVDKTKINSDIAGLGLSQAVGGELDVNVDGSSLEISTDTLQVKADGITKTHINSDVAGSGLGQNVDGSLEVSTGDAIKIASDAVAVDFAVSKTNDNAGSITVRQVVYVKSNGNVDLAQANVANLDAAELGLVEDASIATTAAGKITLRRGAIVGGFSGLTPGKLQYVSRATAGALTEVLTGFVAGEFVYSVGRAISATEILFNPGEVVLEY